MKFKPKHLRTYSAFLICLEAECNHEATKIWSDGEMPIIDLCDFHYQQAQEEREI